MRRTSRSPISKAWLAIGGLLAVGVVALVIREMPSIRRELRLMRM